MAKKHWIKKALAEGKGKLHEHLGVPQGERIPGAKLRAALSAKDPTIRKEAALAATLKGMHKGKKKENKTSMSEKMYGKKEK